MFEDPSCSQTDHKYRFGGEHHRLGPKTMGMRFPTGNVQAATVVYDPSQDFDNDSDTEMIDNSMSLQQREKLDIDEGQRKRARYLRAKIDIETAMPNRPDGRAPDLAPAAEIGAETSISYYDINNPRDENGYAYFIEFVKTNQLILAFSTQHFAMSGHLMFENCRRLGLELDFQDFRFCLDQIENQKVLFT